MTTQDVVPVALVDDHTLVRKGLVELIDRTGGFKVVLEAANGKDLLDALIDGPEVAIAIVDLNMPVMDGFQTIARLTEMGSRIRCLALTFEANETKVIKAMRNGARGFLLKDVEPEELQLALQQIMLTGYYHTDLVHNGLVRDVGQRTAHERMLEKVRDGLNDREKEFLCLVCDPEEYTYEQIAEKMDVQPRTVDGYRQALFTRFGIKSKTGLVLFALKSGLVKLSD